MTLEEMPDFETMSWHDNSLYGLRLEVGNPERDEWHSNLVLDLDHIVEWVLGADRSVRFRVAPVTLTFHDVTDLNIAVDFGDSGHQVNINELSIDGVTRVPVEDQKICLDRPYYRWRIALNLPRGGEISFGASGFTQILNGEPVLCDEQSLPAARRPPPS